MFILYLSIPTDLISFVCSPIEAGVTVSIGLVPVGPQLIGYLLQLDSRQRAPCTTAEQLAFHRAGAESRPNQSTPHFGLGQTATNWSSLTRPKNAPADGECS